MKITKSDITDFIAFTQPSLPAEKREERRRELEAEFQEINGPREVVFLVRGGRGEIEGTLCCLKFQENVFGLGNVKIAAGRSDAEVFGGLAEEAIAHCRALGASRVLARWISGSHPESRKEILVRLGFAPGPRRIEFRRDITGLPSDEGTPFQWRPAGELTDSEYERLGAVLKAAGEGDPDFHPHDDAVELLKGYMQERGLNSGPGCVHLGTIDGQLAAIVVAQVQPSDGWSRITYMGMLPAFRGRGLGTWVHRHGFQMMRGQGGKLYHGGTLAENKRMIRLFEDHGCPVYREMQEWELTL